MGNRGIFGEAVLRPAIEPVVWDSGVLRLLDQRALPGEEVWLEVTELTMLLGAIFGLAVRGAPLLGVVSGYGVLLGLLEEGRDERSALLGLYKEVRSAIASTRPTARNLFDSLERMDTVVEESIDSGRDILLSRILDEACAIHEEERDNCMRIALNGAPLLDEARWVITHCNTGVLATGGIGTALGVIHAAYTDSGIECVWVDETRPLLQGARLTAWELCKLGIPHRIICDSAVASVIASGRVDAAIVGADRIAANGDTANKIGTLSLAIACSRYGVPFYVAAPTSSFDLSIDSGDGIPIEERDGGEVRGFGDSTWLPVKSPTYNPAFDITPSETITAIITERGVIHSPDRSSIEEHFA